MKTKQAKKPRKIIEDGKFTSDEDYEAVILGELGFSTRCIQRFCRNLSGGQIAYRLRKAHVRRIDYRDGTSGIATIVMQNARPIAEAELQRFLKTLK